MRLDHFLKLCGAADSGGQAKYLIQGGQALVNGEIESRRRRKLANGDRIQIEGNEYRYEDRPSSALKMQDDVP